MPAFLSIGGSAPPAGSVIDRVSAAEWQARVDLAAAYRLIAHFGLDETIYNHISARVPDREDAFLINGFGLFYDEIRASNLVKVTVDGEVIDDPSGLGINRAGFVIHSAIHAARHDVACVLHTHSVAGMAVAAQEHGLLPLTQHAATLLGEIAYHDFEGVVLDRDEQARLTANLGSKHILVLRNHGLLTAGRTISEAVQLMLMLDRACKAQIGALAGKPKRIEANIVEKCGDLFDCIDRRFDREWWAMVRLVERLSPSTLT